MTMFTCWFCGKPVDPTDRFAYHRIVAWERNIGERQSGKRAGSDIALRERGRGLAHGSCVDLEKAGLNVRQESLLT